MAAFLITRNPGSGMTAMVRELTRLGSPALDTDDTIAGWETESGLAIEQPQHPTDDWLSTHRWVWSRQRLEPSMHVAGPRAEHVFFCGIAMNQRNTLDLFEAVFLLVEDHAPKSRH